MVKTYNGWEALGFNTYQEYLMSDLWLEKREYILTLKHACEICGGKDNLNVHHKNYESVGNENTEDIIVLCRRCHQKEHLKNG